MKAHLSCVAILALSACGTDTEKEAEVDVLAKSVALADQFQTQLQGELKAALQAGGPIKALSVCHEAAPAIAADLSNQSGAEVRRISLKPRNPGAAVQGEMLENLTALNAAPMKDGKPATMQWSSNGQTHWIRAIPMQEKPCAACHGTNIAPEVKAKIAELYPDDTAVGFKPGEMRGAIAISWATTK